MKYGMFTSYKEASLYLLAGALANGVVCNYNCYKINC